MCVIYSWVNTLGIDGFSWFFFVFLPILWLWSKSAKSTRIINHENFPLINTRNLYRLLKCLNDRLYKNRKQVTLAERMAENRQMHALLKISFKIYYISQNHLTILITFNHLLLQIKLSRSIKRWETPRRCIRCDYFE